MGRPVRNARKRTETALAGIFGPYPILLYLFALESIKRRSRGLLSDFNAWVPHSSDTFDYICPMLRGEVVRNSESRGGGVAQEILTSHYVWPLYVGKVFGIKIFEK
jgi:hypothetical protein